MWDRGDAQSGSHGLLTDDREDVRSCCHEAGAIRSDEAADDYSRPGDLESHRSCE